MLYSAIFLVFISAILHVSWNVLVQADEDPLNTLTKAIGLGVAILFPIVVIYWIFTGSPTIPLNAFIFAFLSGIAELFYCYFLSYSYRHGELSIVYPIARGSAPLLSVILGLLFLRETLSHYQILGVILLLIGIWMVRRAKLSGTKGIMPAFLTGVFIAAYTVIDKIGLQFTNPIYFGALKYLFTALCLILFSIFYQHFTKQKIKNKPSWKKIAVVGVCLIATYQLVLFALNMAPVAIISPLRESASVVVTAWGIWKLKEREGLIFKIIGVIAIFAGIVLLAF